MRNDGPVGMRCPILVGRDAELSALRAHLAGALAGRGGFVLVRGEAACGGGAAAADQVEQVIGRAGTHGAVSTPMTGAATFLSTV